MTAAVILDTLVEASTRALVVAALVALALATFRVKVPAIRHAAWTAALVAMLLLPAVSGWMPTLPLPAWVPDVRVLGPAAVSTPATASVVASPVAARLAERSAGSVEETGATGRAVTTLAADSSGPSASAQVPPAARASTWREWTVIAWLVVACILLLRELAGAWVAHRLASSGVPVDDEGQVFESPRIISPVVVGVLAPRVMVPSSWPQWGAGVREMVLLHERAHVTRRDPLVACLARVNRAVFWFHPVAWWMERHLKTVSEKACDEVVVRAVHEPRLYAAMLVEMARRLQRDGRRVAWQGIGIVDSRRFEDRVDRVLAGPAPELLGSRKLLLAGVSTLLIAAAVACGTSATPLAEDPELAKEIAAMEARTGESRAAIMTTAEDLPSLEKAVADNPADMAATLRLIAFYRNHGQKVLGWDRMVAGVRPHLLRLIERDPESPQSYWTFTRAQDPEGYAQARALWMAHVEKPGVSSLVLAQASEFFSREEQFIAEELLLRGQKADPRGPTVVENGRRTSRNGPWYARTGRLYAKGILGVTDGVFGVISASDPVAAKGAFAQHARRVLAETKDARLLMSAATFMFYNAKNLKLEFDHRAEAREYLRRAAQINPGGNAPALLERFDLDSRHDSTYDEMVRLLGAPADEVSDEGFDRLSDDLKLRYATGLIWGRHSALMQAYQRTDNAGIQSALASFEKRAVHMLEVVARAPQTDVNSRIAADAHIALGTVAMRRGKTADAVARLRQAALAGRPMEKVDGANDDRSSLISYPARRLTYELLDAGERETISAFYEAAAKTLVNEQRTLYEAAAKAIRDGKMPADYQRYLASMR